MKMEEISTHSLTRRLTIVMQCFAGPYNISTHSLTRRLTNLTIMIRTLMINFNSQPHKEADATTRPVLYAFFVISTHSLTRRLTI